MNRSSSSNRRDLSGGTAAGLTVALHQLQKKVECCPMCPGRPLTMDSVYKGGRGYVTVLRCSSPGCQAIAREATMDDYSTTEDGKAAN